MLVAGAYGHSRLGEWFFGGVTRDLLPAAPCLLPSLPLMDLGTSDQGNGIPSSLNARTASYAPLAWS